MGYYVQIEIDNVVIPADKVEYCLKAINKLQEKDRSWSWVEKGERENLQEAFSAWRYSSNFDLEGNLTLEYFEGEKLGDDEILFNTIAPFIRDNDPKPMISCVGEEHERWRYIFDNGTITEQTAKIVWE